MEAFGFVFGHFSEFFVLMGRITGVFLAAPVFQSNLIPFRVKGGLIMVISLVAFPTLVQRGVLPPMKDFSDLIIIGGGEIFIGYMIGFFVYMVITLFQVSGRFYSIQMGFGIINVFDPLAQASVPIVSQLKTILFTIVFLLLNGHHMVIKAVFRSYEWIPTVRKVNFALLAETAFQKFDWIFWLAFAVGIPLIGVVFLITTTLGVLSKLAPQMHVMMIGFGLKVMVGVLTLIALAPALFSIAEDVMYRLFEILYQLFQTLPQ